MKFRSILWLLLFTIGCAKKERTLPQIAPITESVYASGNIKAEEQYKVFSDVAGILHKKYVEVGDTVSEGEVLFSIKDREAKLSTENAALALTRSETNRSKVNELERQTKLARIKLTQDSLMYIRQRNLWKENVGTKSELEQRELEMKSSRTAYLNSLSELKLAKAQFELDNKTAKNNLQISQERADDFSVRSGTNGKVYTISLEEGESVTPQTVLAVIGKPDRFLIEVQVDEDDIARLKLDQEMFITMDSYKGSVFKATVTRIYPIMNESSGTFKVEGVFIKPPPRLYPNQTLEANILISKKDKALVIPRDYLLEENYVLLNHGKKVKVEVGLKNYDYAEIISGLKQDEYIYKP